jgi:hypothetical protein
MYKNLFLRTLRNELTGQLRENPSFLGRNLSED